MLKFEEFPKNIQYLITSYLSIGDFLRLTYCSQTCRKFGESEKCWFLRCRNHFIDKFSEKPDDISWKDWTLYLAVNRYHLYKIMPGGNKQLIKSGVKRIIPIEEHIVYIDVYDNLYYEPHKALDFSTHLEQKLIECVKDVAVPNKKYVFVLDLQDRLYLHQQNDIRLFKNNIYQIGYCQYTARIYYIDYNHDLYIVDSDLKIELIANDAKACLFTNSHSFYYVSIHGEFYIIEYTLELTDLSGGHGLKYNKRRLIKSGVSQMSYTLNETFLLLGTNSILYTYKIDCHCNGSFNSHIKKCNKQPKNITALRPNGIYIADNILYLKKPCNHVKLKSSVIDALFTRIQTKYKLRWLIAMD